VSAGAEPGRTALPVVRRQLADEDITAIVDHYLGESAELALRFIDALEAAIAHIARWPGTGSPRYTTMLSLGIALRHWPTAPFPYLVFYVEHAERIDIWRVLHEERDIPRRLREAGLPAR
jgi:toxin ParE1/3/4